MKKNILLILALLAFGLNVWAQSTSVTVTTEYELKTAIDHPDYSHIHLGADIVLQGVQRDNDDKRLIVALGNREVTLYMDGHSISRDPNFFDNYSEGQVIYLTSGTLQIVCGSDETGQSIISGGHAENGGGIYVSAYARLKLDGITIQNCQAEYDGGAIYNKGTVEIMESSFRTTIQNCTAHRNGGGIYNDGGTLSVSSCDISLCKAPSDHAGAIWNKGPLTVTNCTFTNNSAKDVGGIYNAAEGSGTVSITNCTFTNNSSTNGCGAIGNASNATAMTITGGSISGSTAGTNGGGVWNGSILNLNNVTIQNCQALNTGSEQGRGGAIFNYNGTLTINGGTFQNNASRDGGAIYNKEDAEMTIHGGSFQNNTSGEGGAIYNNWSATLTIHGGTFTDNSATQSGGGAISNHGVLKVYSGTFTENHSWTNGGGIYTNGILNMQGNPVIKDNIGNTGTTSSTNNLYLSDNDGTTRTIEIIGPFTEGARIGLTPYNTSHTLTYGYKSKNPDTSPDVFFFSDNHYGVQLSGNEVVLNTGALVEAANYIDADGIEKTAWTCNWLSHFSDGATLSSGWYIVDTSRTFNSRITVDGDVKFILTDGYTLTAYNGIAVNENNTLTIYGQSGQTGRLDATVTDSQLVLYTAIGGSYPSNTGTITINGGIVTAQGSEGAAGIGGSSNRNGGIITINGGTVSATGGMQGAGIGGGGGISGHGGSITINGGSITAQGGGAEAAGIGGGVVSNGGSITINGGVVNAIGGSNATGIGNAGATITLNWTNLTDSITSTTYVGTVTVATNKFFASTDGTILSLSGTVSDNSILAGKTLIPKAAYNIITECNITEFYDNITLSDTLVFSDSIVTVTITPVDKYTYSVSAIGATSGNEITLNNSGNSYTFTMPDEDVNLHVDFALPYLDITGVTQYVCAIPITTSTDTLRDGWYAVTSTVTNDNQIQAEGNVNIILCDGATMTNSKGIKTYDGKSLTFWGQNAGTGTWEVIPADYNVIGIGYEDFYENYGYISFNGGIIRAQGGNLEYGICGETITLRGGTVWANKYRGTVTLERFFKDNDNTIYEPKDYTYAYHPGTALDNKTLTATGKVFHTEGEWSNTDNWYKGELPSREDYVALHASVTIPAGCVAQAYRVHFSNDATFTIADGGQLIYTYYNAEHPTEDQFITATVEKNIIGTGADDWANASNGWYFITAPMYVPLLPTNVTNMITANDPSLVTETNPDGNSYDLYRYIGDNMVGNESKPWYNYREHEYFKIEKDLGYLYANANSLTLRFTGMVNPYRGADNNQATLVRSGWSLLGNPFTCKVTVDNDFAELNNGSAVDYKASGNTIMPCAGIAVYGNQGDKVTFTMVDPDQAPAPSNASLNIAVTQQATDRGPASIIDNAIVSFNEGSVLPKFNFGIQNANIYIPQDGKEYAIVSMGGDAARHVSTEIPVNFKATKSGTYTISVQPESVEMAYLHLIDNLTGADVNLLVEPTYTFSAKTTDYESRFRLVFASKDEAGTLADSPTFAYINNGNIIINGTGTLQVIDILGRPLITQEITSNLLPPTSHLLLPTSSLPSGVYVLRLINGDDVKTQKIVLNR